MIASLNLHCSFLYILPFIDPLTFASPDIHMARFIYFTLLLSYSTSGAPLLYLTAEVIWTRLIPVYTL